MTARHFAIIALAALALNFSVRAENWPNWRGPHFDGSSSETNLPDTLNLEKNLAWKVALPGRGGATPIIWDDKVFVSSAEDATKDLVAVCYSRTNGTKLWQTKISSGDVSPMNGRNNMAACSPVTDGKHVYFMYGNGDLAKLDVDGKIVWQKSITKDHGPFTILWGYGSSPLLYKDKLYITVLRNHGNDRSKPLDSFLLALNAGDGSVVWKQVRESDAKNESLETYATPMPVDVDGKTQLLINDGEYLTSHDADTGAEIWRFGSYTPGKQPDRRMVVSPVAGAGYAIVTAAKHGSPIYGIKLSGAKGMLKTSDAAWNIPENQTDCSTPAFANGFFYVLDGDKKTVMKVKPETGERVWSDSLPAKNKGIFRASPTIGDGKIYAVRVNGDAYILSAGDQYKVLAELALNEGTENNGTVSSIAIAHGCIFIRTPKTLYCFKK